MMSSRTSYIGVNNWFIKVFFLLNLNRQISPKYIKAMINLMYFCELCMYIAINVFVYAHVQYTKLILFFSHFRRN